MSNQPNYLLKALFADETYIDIFFAGFSEIRTCVPAHMVATPMKRILYFLRSTVSNYQTRAHIRSIWQKDLLANLFLDLAQVVHKSCLTPITDWITAEV